MQHNPFCIADSAQVRSRVHELRHRPSEIKSRLAPTLKALWNPERELRVIQHLEVFEDLRLRFPQFSEVINFYENAAISTHVMGAPFEAPAVLLQGDPGLGKTYFVGELAKCLVLTNFEICLASMSASFILAGGNLQWGEADVGFIAKSLAESSIGNPLILIDELDKASGSAQYDPISVFYGLLEPHSAKKFRDEALNIALDASKVIWIATANYMNAIPAPIQSRMRVFNITQPKPELMRQVVNSIYSNFRETKPFGGLLDEELNISVLEILSTQSPREIRTSIEEGAFKALRHQRRSLEFSDLPIKRKEKHHVGFI